MRDRETGEGLTGKLAGKMRNIDVLRLLPFWPDFGG